MLMSISGLVALPIAGTVSPVVITIDHTPMLIVPGETIPVALVYVSTVLPSLIDNVGIALAMVVNPKTEAATMPVAKDFANMFFIPVPLFPICLICCSCDFIAQVRIAEGMPLSLLPI
jgi:hypothetical protein